MTEGPQPTFATDQTDGPRRWWSRSRIGLAVVIGLAAALVISGVVAVGMVEGFFNHVAETDPGPANAACLRLESRLNRVVPPGATSDPTARARAVRDENGAVRVFLIDIGDLRQDWQYGTDGDRGDWLTWWGELVQARTEYAEALDVQAFGGPAAFFAAPRTSRGDDVVDQLEWIQPPDCAASIRRLAAPDL